MFSYLPIIGFFSAFYSPVGMISYLCVLRVFTVRFGFFDICFLFFLIGTFVIKLLTSELMVVILTFRFYFGFFCFYIYFKSGAGFPVRKLLLFIIFLIPLEALLVNTIIPPELMPNFPSAEIVEMNNTGGYQRPYSFAGSPSVSSSILVVMYSMLSVSSSVLMLFLISVFMLASGTGTLTLILYYAFKRIKYIALFSLFIVCTTIIFFSEIISFIDSFGLKLNSKYILFLIDFKIEQMLFYFQGFDFLDFIIGDLSSLSNNGYGGDFGWLYFVVGYGFLSFSMVVLYVLSKVTRKTIIPLLLMLLATFHYPTIFYLSGQILLGYLMAQKYSTNFHVR